MVKKHNGQPAAMPTTREDPEAFSPADPRAQASRAAFYQDEAEKENDLRDKREYEKKHDPRDRGIEGDGPVIPKGKSRG